MGYIMIILIVSLLIIGSVSFLIARDALDANGRIILKNATISANALADSYYNQYLEGSMTYIEALNQLKLELIGPLNSDGTREITTEWDLGQYGYFIVYDLEGNEVLHPKIEGENRWNARDPINDELYIVREQVALALNGGGFLNYHWEFPESSKIGRKISYSLYNEKWDFVINATSYNIDFNQPARSILVIISFIFLCLIITAYFMSKGFTNRINHPIKEVVSKMQMVDEGEFVQSSYHSNTTDMNYLIEGYNKMIQGIDSRDKDLIVKNQEIKKLAYQDQLTKLPNYYYLRNNVKELIDQNKAFQLIQMDVNNFSLINSIIGFEKGNEVIRLVGHLIDQIIGKNNICTRTGGNEFTLLLIDTSFNYNTFRKALDQSLTIDNIQSRLKFHRCFVRFPEDGETFDELFDNLKIALNYAKLFNIDNVKYSSKLKLFFNKKTQLEQGLIDAFKKNEYKAAYQFQVNKKDEIIGVEGLIRLDSKVLGRMGPGEFLPYINESDYAVDFGIYTIDLFLKDYTTLKQKFNENISIAINISPVTFISKNFTERVFSTIEKYNVPYNKVTLEITEDIFIKDFNLVDEIINVLKSKGVKVAIDDFGTGYSSLNYIQRINADELKIDRSFMKEIINNSKKRELFKSICKIASIYDFRIIVEGIETKEQSDIVKNENIYALQGYYYSRPEFL